MPFAQDAFVAVPVSTSLYAEFARRFPDGSASVMEQVMQDFLDRTAADFEADQELRGISWKGLPLPHGTRILTTINGQTKVAEVVDGKLVFEGEHFTSVNRLALAMRGHATNGWRDLQLQRPGDKEPIDAHELRPFAPGKRRRTS